MFIATINYKTKIWKQFQGPVDEWINEMSEYTHIHTHTHTHTLRNIIQPQKRMKILPFIATWMDLEGIMLSETSQTVKDQYYMILLIMQNLQTMMNQ